VASTTVSHLNDAVQHFQLVLDQCPVSHPDRAAGLANLAWAHLQGYIQKDIQDIDSITSLFREALALRPQGHPDHPFSLYHLLKALIWRFSKETFNAAYIHESAQLSRKLLPLRPEGTYLRDIAAGANGVDYVIRECNKLPIDTSDEYICLRQIVLELCPLGNAHRPKSLDMLAWAIRSRFEQRGSIDDLDECIQRGREAVSLCSEGHSGRDSYLINLGYSILSRFDHQGDPDDLEEAISLYEEALSLRPVGHNSRHFSSDNLAVALVPRFKLRSDVNDITKAINLHREALILRPPDDQYRDYTLNNLAFALQTRHDKLDVSEDLNEAIDLYRDSLRVKQLADPERHKGLHNLSAALCSRYTQTQKSEEVEEAIQLCQESLEALPLLHPARYLSYMRLQQAYLSRYQVQHNLADLTLAVENFRLASQHPSQGFPRRIPEAINRARQAEVYRHDSALEAYQTCLELFDNHVTTRSTIISRREAATAVRGAQSLPVDAASYAVRCNDLVRAVELLEHGRGQQWSLASRLRTPLEDLKSASPELAQKLSEISKRLSDAQGSAGSADRAAADQAAIQYRRLQEQWGAVVSEIRNLEGFSRFLLPPLYEDLQAAARHGLVIILIAS
jgi:tetratricopeptide (TPR) repeat protein